jgi:hypothetical protein
VVGEVRIDRLASTTKSSVAEDNSRQIIGTARAKPAAKQVGAAGHFLRMEMGPDGQVCVDRDAGYCCDSALEFGKPVRG